MVGCELYRHARGAHFKRPISTSARAIVFFLSVLRESAEHKNRPLGCCSAAFGGFPLFERRYYLRAPYNVTLLTTAYCHSNKGRGRRPPTLGGQRL